MQYQVGKLFLLPLFALVVVVVAVVVAAQPSIVYPRTTHLTPHKSQRSDSGLLGFCIAVPLVAAVFPAGDNPRYIYFLVLW